MSKAELVLITGSAGRVGQAAVKELCARGHRVRGFDRAATPGLEDFFIGSIQDAAAVQRAMAGVTSLIHLAATPDDCDDFAGDLVPNNILGLHHVMEAARAAGVRRIILASSGQMNDTQQVTGPFPVRAEDPVTPRYWYAATKMFMESIGYSFAQRHGISVIVARLGWCPRTRAQVEEIAAEERFRDVYFSPGDAGRFFACAVEAPTEVKWAVVYGVSRAPKQARFDLEPAKRLLGFEPREQWPQGVEVVTGAKWPEA
ncbi:MAG: NAD(P)-dependent oxidoreductase [Verrucomicrobia bacterium]|nr:NAD(P)-dependent oxidoreductase [Verrucomicrobiota bacterium]